MSEVVIGGGDEVVVVVVVDDVCPLGPGEVVGGEEDGEVAVPVVVADVVVVEVTFGVSEVVIG